MALICGRCKHEPHVDRECLEPLYWGPKHDADCGCPALVCSGEEDYEWPEGTPPAGPVESDS